MSKINEFGQLAVITLRKRQHIIQWILDYKKPTAVFLKDEYICNNPYLCMYD